MGGPSLPLRSHPELIGHYPCVQLLSSLLSHCHGHCPGPISKKATLENFEFNFLRLKRLSFQSELRFRFWSRSTTTARSIGQAPNQTANKATDARARGPASLHCENIQDSQMIFFEDKAYRKNVRSSISQKRYSNLYLLYYRICTSFVWLRRIIIKAIFNCFQIRQRYHH